MQAVNKYVQLSNILAEHFVGCCLKPDGFKNVVVKCRVNDKVMSPVSAVTLCMFNS